MMDGRDLNRIGIAGFGIMGSGIAQVAGVSGCDVTVVDVDDEAVARGMQRLTESIQKGIALEKVEEGAGVAALDGVRSSTEVAALAGCDLVIEAVTEDEEIKSKVLNAISEAVGDETIIATNTSSNSVTGLARHVSNPGRFAGLHFFNPAPAMRLVEVIPGMETAEETVATLREWVERVDRDPVLVKDQPGFLVNSLLMPYLNQAINEFDTGLASAADIDEAVRLGLGYPKGPLELLDLIGLDTHLHATGAAFHDTADARFAPPPLLRRLVAAGRLGRKSRGGIRHQEDSR